MDLFKRREKALERENKSLREALKATNKPFVSDMVDKSIERNERYVTYTQNAGKAFLAFVILGTGAVCGGGYGFFIGLIIVSQIV